MKKTSKSFILGFLVVLIFLPPLYAQTAANAPADSNAAPAGTTAANPTPAGQAPDDVMKKLSDLVHAGKYPEAQQLTAGLLLAYPDDQRLIKAKTLLDKLPATAGSANAAAAGNPPASNAPSAQPNANDEKLTGMDKVDYNALIELARQAQQNTDLKQQKASLNQFMDQSSPFLQKHPNEMMLWELRAASAMSLDDPMAGYEAGQKLLAMGAADSNDSNLQRLLAQLKNQGWLDRQAAEKDAKYDWILGTWNVSWSVNWHGRRLVSPLIADGRGLDEEFSISGSIIEGYEISAAGEKSTEPKMRGTILDSGEIRWERYFSPSGERYHSQGTYVINYHNSPLYNQPDESDLARIGTIFYPSGYVPVISCVVADNKQTMTMVIPSQDTNPESKNSMSDTVTLLFARNGSTTAKTQLVRGPTN